MNRGQSITYQGHDSSHHPTHVSPTAAITQQLRRPSNATSPGVASNKRSPMTQCHPLKAVSPNVPILSFSLSSPTLKLNNSPGEAMGLQGSPATLFAAAFGDLSDLSKLGELPSEDDLLLHFFDTAVPPPESTTTAPPRMIKPPAPIEAWPTRESSQMISLPSLGGHSYMLQSAECSQLQPSFGSTGLSWEDDAIVSVGQQSRQMKRRAEDSDHLVHNMRYISPNGMPTHHSRARYHEPAAPLPQISAIASVRKPQNPRKQHPSRNSTTRDEDPGANTGITYRGVSRHRLTQRWEASLWLNGRQLYLGGFDSQADAAKAYDLAALACKGPSAIVNFAASEYETQLKEVAHFSREEVVAYVRRRSAAFSRGKSKYRGVSGHSGRWEARIGSFAGKKNVSFGVFDSEEAAARQYDRALILEKGRAAKTNFPLRDYEIEVAEYQHYVALIYPGLPRTSNAVAREIAAYTLPRGRIVTADEKKRSAIIYGESLKRALEMSDQGEAGGE